MSIKNVLFDASNYDTVSVPLHSEFGIVVEHVSQTGSFERLLKIVSCGKGWSVRPVYALA